MTLQCSYSRPTATAFTDLYTRAARSSAKKSLSIPDFSGIFKSFLIFLLQYLKNLCNFNIFKGLYFNILMEDPSEKIRFFEEREKRRLESINRSKQRPEYKNKVKEYNKQYYTKKKEKNKSNENETT